jgi:hypothetical protein
MKRISTTKNSNFFDKKQQDLDSELMPQQSTLDFLMNYSRALHVIKLPENKTIDLILN